jgi:lysophospholipase L1-like esterase
MNTTTKKAANSIVGKLTAAILAVAAAMAPAAAAQNVLVVGDSLQVGTGPYLERELGATPVEFDHRTGRGSLEGVSILRSRIRPEHSIVIFDLGTNDDTRNPDALLSNLNSARGIAGDRCLVVATVIRPPYDGVGVEGMNAAVQRFASENAGVQLVDWHAIATATPGILYADGVHARPEGYALRGRLLAEAVAACSDGGGGGVSAIPAPSGGGRAPAPPAPKPLPAPEVEVEIPTPVTLLAIGSAVREAAALVAAAGQDARRAAGMGPPEPVLGES